MALVCEDERILALHDAAVVVTLDFLESRALTRVRKEGQVGDRVTGNLLAGWFRHYISRDSDPQLHDHAVIFNATFDQEEKVWKALQASCLYCEQRLASEVYRSALVAGLHKLGYRTVHTAKSFEIDGVPRNVIKTFSKRRATIVKIAKNLGQKDNQKAYCENHGSSSSQTRKLSVSTP
jgi:conjugative relaxase-like TrwC/TraI family protein